MNFATVQYLAFFVLIFVLYWNLRRRWQNILLLAASYFFYANWDWRFLGLIFLLTLVNFVAGPRIEHATSPASKKAWLIFSLAVSLGILGFFKYFHFFAGNLVALAQSVGWHLSEPTLRIILPVGISFYTFQSISYVIDIYRGQLSPTRSFIEFATFVAFFPQLVAGPIVRASEFVHQLQHERRFSTTDLESGLERFLLGLFKKLFVADTLGVYLVDPVFANPDSYTAAAHWLALLAYTIQIYADFSGYSSMAIGSARMLGFSIPENFAFPYLSLNASEFWRRWHMTMSRFFRDYVYIGLGGNRKGMKRSMVNVAATTSVSGLWHGAGWTFVVWGWLHGAYVVTYQTWRHFKKKFGLMRSSPLLISIIAAWIVTQAGVGFSWILFRAADFGTFWKYTKGLFTSYGSETVPVNFLILIAFVAVVVDHFAGWLLERNPNIVARIPTLARATAYATMIIFLFLTRPETVSPYIYFQF